MSLTVEQLRAFLADQPGDRLVVMSKDADGNGYSPLADVEEAMYLAETTWSGEVFMTPEQLVEEIATGTGATEEDAAPDDAVRVVYLGPVN